MDTWIKKTKKRGRVNKNVLFQSDTFFKECGTGHEKHDHRFTLPCVELQRVPWLWSFLSV